MPLWAEYFAAAATSGPLQAAARPLPALAQFCAEYTGAIEAVAESVAPLSARALVGLRNNLVTAVFSDLRRVSGWTAPQASLADRIRPRLLTLGPAVLIGLSSDQPSTAFIPQALREAAVALDFASVAERVVAFPSCPSGAC